jgi:hypothetical protein
MSRPPRNRSRTGLTEEQWREVEQDADKGMSNNKDFLDNAFWLPHDVDEELIEALRTFERSKGKGEKKDKKLFEQLRRPLIDLLRRRGNIPAYIAHRDVYFFLADLLDRHQLMRKRGGQQTPLYDLPDEHRRLMLAKADMAKGKSLEQAAADHRYCPTY